jgi:SET domain-containing protein
MSVDILKEQKMIEIRKTKKLGRGVFTTAKIKKGQTIITDHVLIIGPDEYDVLKKTIINFYWYEWGEKKCAICFGTGSLFNHAINHNIEYILRIKKKTISFVANRDIKAGEQLFINYGYDPVKELRIYEILKK